MARFCIFGNVIWFGHDGTRLGLGGGFGCSFRLCSGNGSCLGSGLLCGLDSGGSGCFVDRSSVAPLLARFSARLTVRNGVAFSLRCRSWRIGRSAVCERQLLRNESKKGHTNIN